MSPKQGKLLILGVSLGLFAMGLVAGCSGGKDNVATNSTHRAVPTTAEEEDCSAPDEWFSGATPIPTNAKPRADVDCDFYKWAWQTFLFVTQPAQGGSTPQFLTYENPDQIFGLGATQRFPGSKNAEVLNSKVLELAPRVTEQADPLSSHDVLQAGSKGLLVDQNGHAIYYGIHLNSVFAGFIRDNGYNDPSKLVSALDSQVFPTGALELKSSWAIVQPGENTDSYFTTTAIISNLKQSVTPSGTSVVIDPGNTRTVTVKLLGLHVVGVVDGHPEFIWATFEHVNNDPNLQTDPPGNPPNDPKGQQAVSDTNWTLYAKGTPAVQCNLKAGGINPLHFVGDPKNQVLNPVTNVFRQFQFGNDDDPSPIRQLNASVKSKLPASRSVWKNYELHGAVWINDPADFKVNVNFGQVDRDAVAAHQKGILGGDTMLSNSTMETFTQGTASCFDCHRTVAESITSGGEKFPAKKLSISHILTNAYLNRPRTP